ncbi:pre-mRNA-splicing factor CWC26-like [Curcuma longa]|uniref:pre-mRNA-splicing factor CWC26-like n=1 Tax=Curcuma longa TaxID=136217 RepID=UPI003D9F1CFD
MAFCFPLIPALSLKDYLKRYQSTGEDDEKKKKKQKKMKVKPNSMGGILVVDEDPVWQKPVQIEQEESASADEDKPQIDEDIEVKRMKRLEAIRARKPYHAISEDGSGWVSISNSSKSSNDLSPPRQVRLRFGTPSPADLSPPRKSRKVLVEKEPRRGGLLSAKELREENDRTKKESLSRFASLDPSLSGKSAEPVYRDAKGKAISKEELLKSKEKEKPKEKKLEWGKGLVQKRQAKANTRELELEKEKPFARTKDDPDLDKMLKERVRWGDPMAHLVKKNSETILEDFSENEAMKTSGFIIPQMIPAHSWLKRVVDCPPNRYGIKPGRHWDGVDRSNGFEKDMYKRQNEKRATEREAYLWSVYDM